MGGRLRFVLAISLAAVISSAACSLSLDGFSCGDACDDAAQEGGPDVSAGGEAGVPPPPPPPPPPGSDGGVDATHDAADAAPDAPVATYSCPGSGKVTDCSACASGKVPCFLCGSNGADKSKIVGFCVTSATSGSACEGNGPAGFDDCLCNTASDPSPCIADHQICLEPFGPACRTCGYDGGAGQKCKGGGTCTAAGVCQ